MGSCYVWKEKRAQSCCLTMSSVPAPSLGWVCLPPPPKPAPSAWSQQVHVTVTPSSLLPPAETASWPRSCLWRALRFSDWEGKGLVFTGHLHGAAEVPVAQQPLASVFQDRLGPSALLSCPLPVFTPVAAAFFPSPSLSLPLSLSPPPLPGSVAVSSGVFS